MTEWKQLIYLTVELMICAMLVTYGVFLNNIAKTSNDIQQKEADTMEILAEYREFNKFDNTLLWSQDVISTILQYRGEPAVSVKYNTSSSNGAVYKNGTYDIPSGITCIYTLTGMTGFPKPAIAVTENLDFYTNEFLSNCFGVSSKYHATLHKDANGTIDTIVFVKCEHPDDDITDGSHQDCT